MNKTKILSALGLVSLALSLTACSSKQSNSNSTSQSRPTTTTNKKKSTSEQNEDTKSKKEAEKLAKALHSNKANFEVHIPVLDDSDNVKVLPSSNPTVSISEFIKENNLNDTQKPHLEDLIPKYYDLSSLKKNKDDNGKLISKDTFNTFDNIESGYFSFSNIKVKKDYRGFYGYSVTADLITHLTSKDGYQITYSTPEWSTFK